MDQPTHASRATFWPCLENVFQTHNAVAMHQYVAIKITDVTHLSVSIAVDAHILCRHLADKLVNIVDVNVSVVVEVTEASRADRVVNHSAGVLDCIGDAPQRDYFYWELHRGHRPVQAARFGTWKAVRNGIDKPIEIYDLTNDSAESNDLAKSRPDLVQKAHKIFKKAHRPDPNWPLDRRTEAHSKSAAEAWKIKRWRDKTKWIPDNALRKR